MSSFVAPNFEASNLHTICGCPKLDCQGQCRLALVICMSDVSIWLRQQETRGTGMVSLSSEQKRRISRLIEWRLLYIIPRKE
jgi:hypothetical protein